MQNSTWGRGRLEMSAPLACSGMRTRAGDNAQQMECLPSMQEAPGSIDQTGRVKEEMKTCSQAIFFTDSSLSALILI